MSAPAPTPAPAASSSSATSVADTTAALAATGVDAGEDGPVELNPDGSKKLSKSQLKKQEKMAAIAARKAQTAGAAEAAKQSADQEKIDKAKAIKLVQDPALKEAKRVRHQRQACARLAPRSRQPTPTHAAAFSLSSSVCSRLRFAKSATTSAFA